MTLVTVPYSSPVFFDKKVDALNTELETLGWISKQYPICFLGETEEGTFPEVYYNDGTKKNLKVMPEGDAISFFVVNGEIEQVEEFHYRLPLSLIVWADLSHVYQNKAYDYTSELVKDVIGILENNSCNDLVIEVNNVFNEYTFLQKLLNQNTMRPYTAFRINFTTIITKC